MKAAAIEVSTEFVQYEKTESGLKAAIADSSGAIRDMCLHLLEAGGKRIRPLLVINSGRLINGGSEEELLQAAVAAELIHMASLVHDDILDNSALRRSRPSVNSIWGGHDAVLCGDYLFAKAFGILSGGRVVSAMEHMVEAIQRMCRGEVLQAEQRYRADTCLEVYYRIIGDKTAALLACCCKAGAAVAGAGSRETRLLAEYGMNLGLAFQIVDDLLDLFGDTSVMGKPAGEDLANGNLTLPVILLLEDPEHSDWLKKILMNRDINAENIRRIKNILEYSGIYSKTCSFAESHIERARSALIQLPGSDSRTILWDLAGSLKSRVS